MSDPTLIIKCRITAFPDHADEQRFPELKLLRAVLCRAILDFNLYRERSKTDSLTTQSKNSKSKHVKTITKWFKSNDYHEFSFLWICEHLFPENHATIVKRIRAFIKTKDYRFKIAGVT
jgi:hypothetical protein